MNLAHFTITYYYDKYKNTDDINKKHCRTATVYADNLPEAIKKIKEFDSEFIMVAENGVSINERLKQKKQSM